MSYKYSSGSVRRGDIYFEDDRVGDATYIDFGQDTITLRPSGSAILHAEATKVGIGTSSPDNTLHVEGPGTTHLKIASATGYEAALKLKSGNEQSAYVWQPGNTSDLRFYVAGADRMHIDNDGNVGIGTTSPVCALDIGAPAIRIRNSSTPSSASDTGAQGEIRWDANYLYVCVAIDTWKRIPLDSW
jgi:hypothetical protein